MAMEQLLTTSGFYEHYARVFGYQAMSIFAGLRNPLQAMSAQILQLLPQKQVS